MQKMILVLSLSFGSVILGYIIQRLVISQDFMQRQHITSIAKWIKILTLSVLLPWPIMFTFWRIENISPRFLIIPFLGIFSLIVGGVSAVIFIRIRKLPPEKAGSLFACGMMTNLGVIGGLIGMLFFGKEGYLTVQLFTMFEVFTYYLIVFPLSQQIGQGSKNGFHLDIHLLLSKPMSLIPLTAIIVGFILRSLKIPPPEVLDTISAILVPSVTGLIGLAIGLTLRVSRISMYRTESLQISLIKFLIIPLIIIPTAAILGLPNLMDGTAFKMIIFLSFSPVALIAMVPPQLYELDLDLANSGWLLTTLGHLIIVPILMLILL